MAALSPERERELCARYPSYARFAAAGGTAWCRDGWFDLLCGLLSEVEGVNSEATVTVVKEKLGLLRVGVDGLGEGSFERLLRWERASGQVCEVCGTGGALRQNGRALATRCEDHRRVPTAP